jgi:methyl-accepting chemotaxis protein
VTRRLPLGGWLALGFALAVAAPALSAGAAWWAVDARQQADADARLRQATVLIERTGSRLADRAVWKAAAGRLAELGVEADLQLSPPKVLAPGEPSASEIAATKRVVVEGGFVTQALAVALERPDGKRELTTRYEDHALSSGPVAGTLFVTRPNRAMRFAAASGAGLLALALAVIAGVVLLRRWVVAPLARLAGDAERIAGGELDVAPVNSRTREVAEVGAALRGMADGLRDALADQHAAEQQRRFLLSAIAHDLRTPLFTLRGSLEAIEHGIGDADHLRRARDKATLLDRLVGDLFTFSRL